MFRLSTPPAVRSRTVLVPIFCALAAAAPGAARATERSAPHEQQPAARAAVKPVADAAAAKVEPKPAVRVVDARDQPAAPPRPAPRAAGHGARDPMDVVRERLAEKLGATKAPDASNPNVLRVVSRAGTAPGVAARAAAGHGGGGGDDDVGRTAARPVSNRPAAFSRQPAGGGAGHVPGEPAAPHAAHWDYQGAGGPDAWAQLKPEFSTCASGTRQSPIDIRDGVKVQLDEVHFDYRPSGFRVIDNGHTVQVNVASGNSIEVLGRHYDLLQFHFHRPSEERVNGRQFEMVAHLVHKDPEGRLAVVAVLLDRGAAQPVVQSVWNNLPLEKGEEVAAQTTLDLNALLPADRSYYTYMGSLTTPPCSEGVLWMVLKNPVPVSPQQVSIFSRLYPMNARPIQSAAGRLIKESN